MCYIFSCFGWALDFLQRTLTFILACILSCIITIGILVAIAAGVAYGYNYSMAEFLTFTRQDTSVYMRRGQFYDKPDFDTDKDVVYSRRSGGGANDVQNVSLDYQDQGPGMNKIMGKGLPNVWGQLQDTRRYAELLTKYSRKPEIDDPVMYAEDELTGPPPTPPTPPTASITAKRVSVMTPNPGVVLTSVIGKGPSRIVMRKYMPISNQGHVTSRPDLDMTNSDEESDKESDRYSANNGLYPDEDQDHGTKFFELNEYRPTISSLPPITTEQTTDKLQTDSFNEAMRHWGPPKQPVGTEAYVDYKEDIDEDNVVYKPV